jgi:hypothetical protein
MEIISMEDAGVLTVNIVDDIETTLLKSRIVLPIEESNQIFDILFTLVEKEFGYPEYKHHM